MTRAELALLLDHSVLKPEATERDIRSGADIVRNWRIGYYCVQPIWVRAAADALEGTGARVVAVVGFPHGCERTAAKVTAAEIALADGATELDMVVNLGALKGGDGAAVGSDIAAVVRAAQGLPVKVILETRALLAIEKRIGCRLTRDAGAAFVKTSTGFHAA